MRRLICALLCFLINAWSFAYLFHRYEFPSWTFMPMFYTVTIMAIGGPLFILFYRREKND